jgi:AcrR family transcriptional regulator
MTESYQKWIEEGYKTLANEGPEGIIVEKLAKHLGYNKSGFYHYFGDMEIFLNRILDHHIMVGKQFAEEVPLCRTFDPEYLKLLIKFKDAFKIQMQLRRHMDNPLFRNAFQKVEKQNEDARNKLWSDYLGIIDKPQLALKMWELMRDMIFMRFSTASYDLEFLKSTTSEIKNLVNELRANDEESDNKPERL